MNSRIEILESRIAPATFLVSSTQLTITNAANPAIPPPVNPAAAAAAGASAALFLNAGDSLVFDATADGKVGAGDVTLMSVKTGSAIAFLTDFSGDNRFGLDEFTGAAV